MAPYDWANGSYVDVFLTWGVWFYLRELMLFSGMVMEIKDKIMIYCSRPVKCKQGFTTGI